MSTPALRGEIAVYDRARALAAACGAAGALRLEIHGGGAAAATSHRIEGGIALVGRDEAADVVLPHPDVSRRHAVLAVIAGRVLVVDLESRTGIEWIGKPEHEGWLAEGEAIRVGPYRIEAKLDVAPSDAGWPEAAAWPPGCRFPLSSRPLTHDQLPALVLDFPGSGGHEAATWEMRSLVSLVGSSDRCKVRIDSSDVSKFEAMLIRTPRGAWAVGLMGRAGLRERGEPSRFIPLLDGEAFQVGDWPITPRIGAPTRAGDSSPTGLSRRGRTPRPLVATTRPTAPSTTELVDQFGQMQAEMLDQVRQSLMTMGRWLGSLHQEEMERMRAELSELRAAILAEKAVITEPAPPQLPMPEAPRAVSPPPSPQDPPPDTPRAPAADAGAGEDLHRLLVGRIEKLQREHKQRWKRLVQRPMGRDG